MEKLGEIINKNTFCYTLVKREGDVVIYAQRLEADEPESEIIAYEVFKVKSLKENRDVVMGDNTVTLEAKEYFASNEDFGATAFSCKSLSRAEHYFKLFLNKCNEVNENNNE